MARRKKIALDVPTSAEEARRLVEEYVAAERTILELRLGAQISIEEKRAKLSELLEPLQAGNAARFAAIAAWWEAGGKDVAGKSRSAEFGGAKLGLRLTPHAVKLKRGLKVDAVIDWISSWKWSRKKDFLREKVELDKPAIIKAAQAEPELRDRFAEQGVTVEQADEFFIDTGLDEDEMRKSVGLTDAG